MLSVQSIANTIITVKHYFTTAVWFTGVGALLVLNKALHLFS